jgi:hypothetical protein
MNARFLAIAADPRLIPGVHHYCDEWCGYCPVTTRCLSFRCTEDWRKQHQRSPSEPPFASMEEAVAFTRQLAEVEGTTTEELDALMNAPPGRSNIHTSDPLVAMAWEYAVLAAMLLTRMCPAYPQIPVRPDGPSPHDVLVWYHVRIYIKVFRAIVAKERSETGKADRAEDATGCAKLALVSIQRSREALRALPQEDDYTELLARLQLLLDTLEHGLDERLPEARRFVRIGIDVPAAA